MNYPLVDLFSKAVLVTARLAGEAAAASFMWGTILFFLSANLGRVGGLAVGAYVQLLRNIPVLLPIYLIYFGLPMIGLPWSAETCGVIALVLQQGAYVSEILRGSAKAVDRTQHDASLSIGISEWTHFRKVVLPQILVYSLPALGSQTVLLLKDTSLLSAITVTELMMQAKLLVESTGSIYTPFIASAALFLVLTGMVDLGFESLSRAVKWR